MNEALAAFLGVLVGTILTQAGQWGLSRRADKFEHLRWRREAYHSVLDEASRAILDLAKCRAFVGEADSQAAVSARTNAMETMLSLDIALVNLYLYAPAIVVEATRAL